MCERESLFHCSITKIHKEITPVSSGIGSNIITRKDQWKGCVLPFHFAVLMKQWDSNPTATMANELLPEYWCCPNISTCMWFLLF